MVERTNDGEWSTPEPPDAAAERHVLSPGQRAELDRRLADLPAHIAAGRTRSVTGSEEHPVLAAIRKAPLRKEPMTAEERAYYDDMKARIEAGKPNLLSGEFFSLLRADGAMTGQWIDAKIAGESRRRGLSEPELLDLGRRTKAALSEADTRLKAMAAGEEPALPMAQVYAEVKAKHGLS